MFVRRQRVNEALTVGIRAERFVVCVYDELMRCRGLLNGTILTHDQDETQRFSIDNGAICV